MDRRGSDREFLPDEPDKNWGWVTGEEFGYTNWHEGQPDNHQMLQSHLHYWDVGSGLMIETIQPQWDDANAFYNYAAFIVEYSSVPVPEPNSILLGLAGLIAIACLWLLCKRPAGLR